MNRAYLLLLALTSLTIVFFGGREEGALVGALILSLTWWKIRLVFDHFVGLRSAGIWRTALSCTFFMLMIVLYVPYALS